MEADKNEQLLKLMTEMNNKMDDGFKKTQEGFDKFRDETNKNIKIIAEGHRDLNNKLDRALTIENEKELFLIRLNILENEVERIKTRIN